MQEQAVKCTFSTNAQLYSDCNLHSVKNTAVVNIKSQSGFSWDDELSANISPADTAYWMAFAKIHFSYDMTEVLM